MAPMLKTLGKAAAVTLLVLALVAGALLLAGCSAGDTQPDAVDQQVIVLDLAARCRQGKAEACRRLPAEKQKLIKILSGPPPE